VKLINFYFIIIAAYSMTHDLCRFFCVWHRIIDVSGRSAGFVQRQCTAFLAAFWISNNKNVGKLREF
jgi:hypothetical protein